MWTLKSGHRWHRALSNWSDLPFQPAWCALLCRRHWPYCTALHYTTLHCAPHGSSALLWVRTEIVNFRYRRFAFVMYTTECERWKRADNVYAANGVFYPFTSVADCMNLCVSISNCVAIDVWSEACSIHMNASDLLTNRLISGVSQFILDRSCTVSTVSATLLETSLSTFAPTSGIVASLTLILWRYDDTLLMARNTLVKVLQTINQFRQHGAKSKNLKLNFSVLWFYYGR